MRKKTLLSVVSLLAFTICFSQADTTIVLEQKDNKVLFKANLPRLTQIPGAPTPFYTYFWDFGDGHFSTEESPEHIYSKAGDFEAGLYAVNNYDDGKKPGRKPKNVPVNKVNKANLATTSPAEQNFFKANGFFEMKYNCMAKPGDTMLLVAGWKNDVVTTGKLYFFINEKQFGRNSFDTAAVDFYHDGKLMADNNAIANIRPIEHMLITNSGSPASHIKEEKKFSAIESKTYLTSLAHNHSTLLALDVKDFSADPQFLFANLRVLPEMIKDSNATIVITGLFVPDSGEVYMHQLNIPIVTSHDPNKMSLKQGRLNYRTLRKNKSLTYKIRFQNDGEGPAKKIKLAITLPNQFDPKTVSIKDMSPYCLPCDSVPSRKGCWDLISNADSLEFVFNGIYLPGTSQKNVSDKDSTKGFVEFDVKTKKKLDNLPFKGRTAIYFDKNEPVITNFATGRFLPAISPMIMAGYEMNVSKNRTSSGPVIGAAIARLAPHKPYLQFEIFFISSNSSSYLESKMPGVVQIDRKSYDYRAASQTIKTKALRVGLVPLHYRYNFNNYFSAGAGIRLDADIAGTIDTARNYILSNFNGQVGYPYQIKKSSKISSFNNPLLLPFVDVQGGSVRLGPQLGTRFYFGGKDRIYLYFYASWRL